MRALTYGADDYIAEPPRIVELCARADVLLRRAYPILYGHLPFTVGLYYFNPQHQQVILCGEPIMLTGIEFQLALPLFSNVGRISSRDHILGQAWGCNSSEYTRTIDSHASRTRVKLNVEPVNEMCLVVVCKYGYRVDHLRPMDDMNMLSDMSTMFYST